MSNGLVTSKPWPAEPAGTAGLRARLSWYAAVARWAPSKHNAQPWTFVVRGDALEIWADVARPLTSTDPHQRERVISFGAAVQLACVAARALGRTPHVTVTPAADDRLVACVSEEGPWDTSEDDRRLLAAAALRRTDRGPLDDGTLPAGLAFQLQSAAAVHGASLRLVSSPGERATLAALVERADRLLVRRGDADAELAPWLRDQGDVRLDGVPADNTRGAAASYRAEFVQRDFSTTTSRAAQDRAGRDHPIVGVLCTPSDRVDDWVAAGRALTAVLLRATDSGANASYLNQPVEEPAVRAQLREHLELSGVAQLVLRLGAGGDVAAPARRDVHVLALDVERPASRTS